MSDAEIDRAQEALRNALAWGAQYYEPRMYGQAQATLDAARAARDGDPVRCRSLLSETTDAASSAKAAALRAYEQDVQGRFETSRAQLLEIGADRAFPDEFARLVSGIDATVALFAAGSYRDARFKAYGTLKGMGDLYDTVRGLQDWFRDAQPRVERALTADRAMDAPKWAPAEMASAQQQYDAALAQMEVGNLEAAVGSMKAAGQIAANLPLLHGAEDTRAAGRPALPAPEAIASSRLQPPSVDVLPVGQRVRIGGMSMSPLGPPQKLYTAFSAAVARFDIVAAEGLRDAGIMEKVLAGMDESWEAAVSGSGYFGFIYDDRIQMVKDLGTYPGQDEFLHAPYAAQFRLVGTRFRLNLVLCHVEANPDRKLAGAEGARLAKVYRYFEKLTGNRGITLLLAGGLTGMPRQASEPAMPQGEMVPLRANAAAAGGPHGTGMFAGAPLRSLVEESGFGASNPPVAFVTLGSGKSDN